EGPGRRLHAVLRRDPAILDCAADTKGQLRSAEGLRADFDPGHQPLRAQRSRLGPGENAEGVHRLREGASGRTQLLLGRHWLRRPSYGDAVRLARRTE